MGSNQFDSKLNPILEIERNPTQGCITLQRINHPTRFVLWLIFAFNRMVFSSLFEFAQRYMGTSASAKESSKKITIAIIGGGVAGLQAARTILTSSLGKQFNVIIFEARDRIGGRVNTRRPWGAPIDYGESARETSPLIFI
jgi:NADPH-dependent 2,4-dienoyl-CoA reductase/sulfur reductase-like enzyme